MELEATLLACLSSDKQLRTKAEAAVGQLQKSPAGSVQLFQLMQSSQRDEVSPCWLGQRLVACLGAALGWLPSWTTL